MKKLALLAFSPLLWIACSMQTTSNTVSSGPYAYSGQLPVGSADNVVPITMGCGYINEPCVAVEFCKPGAAYGSSDCTLIDHVLLDTGSYGLRVFASAVTISLSQNVPGLAEVVQYADSSCDWGPVKTADVYLGNEKAASVPIQIIDPSYGSVPPWVSTHCGRGLESDPQLVGFNAILGVGLFSNDCPSCTTAPASNGNYYDCSSGTCYATTASAANQVTNPVALLSSDYNNGVMLSMSSVGSIYGSNSVVGGMTLGIDTPGSSTAPTPGYPDGNNSSSGVTVFAADSNLFFDTTFPAAAPSHIFQNSFIDSGSNLWDFADDYASPRITHCSDGFYCDTAHNLQARPGSGNPVTFNIDNANTVLNSNATAYDNIGAYWSTSYDSFDWGMPFYYGRNIFHLIKNKTATNMGGVVNPGPAWGFSN